MKRTYLQCDKCLAQITKSNFGRHIKRCDGVQTYHIKRLSGQLEIDNSTICRFCNKSCKNANSQRNHSRLCKLNPDRQFTYLVTHREEARKNVRYSNQYTKAKALGLPKPQRSAETRQKLSKANKNRSQEVRDKISKAVSETVKKKVQEGTWHTSLAKKMHYSYKGVDLHGKWELKYAEFLDKNGIKWERCKKSFPYVYENKNRRYTPDFYLLETNEYIEIKGYKTAKDDAKWNQFPIELKLKVLLKKDLSEMGMDV